MRKLTVIILFLVALVAQTKVYSPQTLPFHRDSLKYSRVINPDSILDARTVAAIDTVLYELQDSTGVQGIVVAITNVEGDDMWQFTYDVYNRLGIGNSKKNTGFLLTLATDDRSYFLMPGTGLEGTLPDAICRRIEDSYFVPLLKEGKWNEAMLQTVEAISKYVEGDETIREPIGSSSDSTGTSMALIALLAAIGLPAGFIAYQRRQAKKCPQCGKYVLKRNRQTEHKDKDTIHVTVTTTCPECGYHNVSEYDMDTSRHDDDSRTGGAILGGGGVFSGGGSTISRRSFGSLGGGRTSGGGAGGRF